MEIKCQEEKLSVIISAFNEHKITVVHVRECMNSTLMPDEIIVVNDNGTPDLKKMLLQLELKTKVVYARINEDIKWNYTGARNLGIWLSTGEYISVEDNDHIPMPDFYKLAWDKLHQGYDRIKTEKRRVISKEDILTKPPEEWITLNSRPPHQDTVVLRRTMLLKVKGYDERFAGAYGWCSTDARRRFLTAKAKDANAGYQWVVEITN